MSFAFDPGQRYAGLTNNGLGDVVRYDQEAATALVVNLMRDPVTGACRLTGGAASRIALIYSGSNPPQADVGQYWFFEENVPTTYVNTEYFPLPLVCSVDAALTLTCYPEGYPDLSLVGVQGGDSYVDSATAPVNPESVITVTLVPAV